MLPLIKGVIIVYLNALKALVQMMIKCSSSLHDSCYLYFLHLKNVMAARVLG